MVQNHRTSRIIVSLGLAALAGLTFATDAMAWDHCGVGRHRTVWGQCISNYASGPGLRGCPIGYHLGNYAHACFPNGY